MNHVTPIAIIVLLIIAVAATSSNADRWRDSYKQAEKARKEAVALADTRQKTIDDMK
ncbi:hypothetical protein A4J56_005334, partial [Salmonella enterica subsp. diarizonae]|nr:hypothetical protein [Salmonella enterica subsp. diarizonae]